MLPRWLFLSRKLLGGNNASSKKWFNKECKEARKQFRIASNDRNRFPQNEQLKKEALDLLKQYIKMCNMKRE